MCAFKKPIYDLKSLKNQMRTTPYHFDLIWDQERLSVFHEAIIEMAGGIVFDIGSGCGILSILASFYSDRVYSVEINPKAAKCAQSNFKPYSNITLINDDARDIVFPEKADLIICEMLDTALIDEEQIPVLNSILKYLKRGGNIIPCRILNAVELVSMKGNIISYEDDVLKNLNYESMSDMVIYNQIEFKNKVDEDIDILVEFDALKEGNVSGIKITTFTLLTPDIICGPTPMLNPPLMIPTGKIKVNKGDTIKMELSYKMGGGLDNIRTRVERVP